MPDLLLELFSEEIPARMQAKAADDLRRMVSDKLVAEGLVYEGAKAFATPRRLTLTVHGIPARHEFDGNDYQATHMIVYAGDEPVGTLRIRWFKDFAKLERTAFREAYRNTHVLKVFAYFVFDHVARKGYDKVITHAQPKYARLWRIILGFKKAEGKEPVYFDGHPEPYIELVKELTPPLNAISASTDAAILFRTEGFWDAPSQYEAVA